MVRRDPCSPMMDALVGVTSTSTCLLTPQEESGLLAWQIEALDDSFTQYSTVSAREPCARTKGEMETLRLRILMKGLGLSYSSRTCLGWL